MKKILLALFVIFVSHLRAAEPIRIACIGNSITYGATIANRFQNSYPSILQQMLGETYDVRNFGINGRVLLQKGDYPYMRENYYKEVKAFLPNIITIKLGTNDSKPHNWIYGKDFGKDMDIMLKELKALPSKPTIYVCLPVKAWSTSGINDSIILHGIIPVIKKIARKHRVTVIDTRTPLQDAHDLFPDDIHPNEVGATILAQTIYTALTGKDAPKYDWTQPFPGKVERWKGFDKYSFVFKGRQAIVVTPQKAATGNPWIWRPAFFGAFPSVDEALLKEGWHVAYYDLTHLYGSPRSVHLGKDFFDAMTRNYHLMDKVVVEGFSRGGYFAYNYAARYPETVSALYVDAPVCDITSWPGRKNEKLWNDFLTEWNLQDVDVNERFVGNAMNLLPKLANANIPIISVCGAADKVVPFAKNTKPVREAYESLGGIMELVVKPNCDHHPHSLDDPEPIVDFLKRYQPGYTQQQRIQHRGILNNAFTKFIGQKKGCVAFLGGSITEMNGWRDMIMDDLRQRFPETEFQFIEAGISSLGSTPHAFRFADDVLRYGTPDLLFVEAAVNDDTNAFNPDMQIKGMEGIIRHALYANPLTDIVMLHFIYDPFIALHEKGIQPDVIMNHERVANWYGITSINLSEEIASRMRNQEFTWEEFGGTHPAPLGHKYYVAAINEVFDRTSQFLSQHAPVAAHPLPKALDEKCFDQGKHISIEEAKQLHGFHIVPSWNPNDGVATRKQFVNIPMLVADKAGSSFVLDFEGNAIGLFCVSGPQSAKVEYRIDNGPLQSTNTYTQWSGSLYLPFIYMLDTNLSEGKHKLQLRIASGEHTGLRICYFAVN